MADILLVEDNPYEAKLAISSLEDCHLADNLTHVDDGAEALDFVFARGKYANRITEQFPKLILLDLNLPKIGGLEVLRQIKSDPRTKGVPVVILSSSKQERDIIAGYKFGANSYVVKPVDYDVFSKAVSDMGLYWTVLNQPNTIHYLNNQ